MKNQAKKIASRYKIHNIWKKYAIAIGLIPLMMMVAILKLLSHKLGLEVMELNALLTSLVAGVIFLIGFLIAGVLSDYKESEKIPSEIVAALKTLYDDAYTLYRTIKSEKSHPFIEQQKLLAHSLIDWLHKKERTQSILNKITDMNDYFSDFDNDGSQPNYIIKMKNEQSSLRKLVLRIDTIRDTSFVGSAYAIVEIMGVVITLGLVITRIEPFYASLFFTPLVTYIIFYMLLLIKDLDNPFDYSGTAETGTEISLKPLHDHIDMMDTLLATDKP